MMKRNPVVYRIDDSGAFEKETPVSLLEKLEKVKANLELLSHKSGPILSMSMPDVVNTLIELTQALIDDANERKPARKAKKKKE